MDQLHALIELVGPILVASAEGMLWVLLAVTLYLIGRGHILPSQRTISIERPCQYRLTMAPELNLAQPYIEAVAQGLAGPATDRSHFPCEAAIADRSVATRQHPCYFLRIDHRDGLLILEASRHPTLPGSDCATPVLEVLETVGQPRGIMVQPAV
jgi:hypothetical protein